MRPLIRGLDAQALTDILQRPPDSPPLADDALVDELLDQLANEPFGPTWNRLLQASPALDLLGDDRGFVLNRPMSALITASIRHPQLARTSFFVPIINFAARALGVELVITGPEPDGIQRTFTFNELETPQPNRTIHLFHLGEGHFQALTEESIDNPTPRTAPPITEPVADTHITVDGSRYRIHRTPPGRGSFFDALTTSARLQNPNSPLGRLTPQDIQNVTIAWLHNVGNMGPVAFRALDLPRGFTYLNTLQALIEGLDTQALNTILQRPPNSPPLTDNDLVNELVTHLINQPFGPAWNRLLQATPALDPLGDLRGLVQNLPLSGLVMAAIRAPEMARTAFFAPVPVIVAQALGIELAITDPGTGADQITGTFNPLGPARQDRRIHLLQNSTEHYDILIPDPATDAANSAYSDDGAPEAEQSGQRQPESSVQRNENPPPQPAPSPVHQNNGDTGDERRQVLGWLTENQPVDNLGPARRLHLANTFYENLAAAPPNTANTPVPDITQPERNPPNIPVRQPERPAPVPAPPDTRLAVSRRLTINGHRFRINRTAPGDESFVDALLGSTPSQFPNSNFNDITNASFWNTLANWLASPQGAARSGLNDPSSAFYQEIVRYLTGALDGNRVASLADSLGIMASSSEDIARILIRDEPFGDAWNLLVQLHPLLNSASGDRGPANFRISDFVTWAIRTPEMRGTALVREIVPWLTAEALGVNLALVTPAAGGPTITTITSGSNQPRPRTPLFLLRGDDGHYDALVHEPTRRTETNNTALRDRIRTWLEGVEAATSQPVTSQPVTSRPDAVPEIEPAPPLPDPSPTPHTVLQQPLTPTEAETELLGRIRPRLADLPAGQNITEQQILTTYRTLRQQHDFPLSRGYDDYVLATLLGGPPPGTRAGAPGDHSVSRPPWEASIYESSDGSSSPAPGHRYDHVTVHGSGYQIERTAPDGDSFINALVASARSQRPGRFGSTTDRDVRLLIAGWLAGPEGATARLVLDNPEHFRHHFFLKNLLADLDRAGLAAVLGEPPDGQADEDSLFDRAITELTNEPAGAAWNRLLQVSPALAPVGDRTTLENARISDLVALAIQTPGMGETPFFERVPAITAQALGITLTVTGLSFTGGMTTRSLRGLEDFGADTPAPDGPAPDDAIHVFRHFGHYDALIHESAASPAAAETPAGDDRPPSTTSARPEEAQPKTSRPEESPPGESNRAENPAPWPAPPVVEPAGNDHVLLDGHRYQRQRPASGGGSFLDALITSAGSLFPPLPLGRMTNEDVRLDLVEWLTEPRPTSGGTPISDTLNDPRDSIHQDIVRYLVQSLDITGLRGVLGPQHTDNTDLANLQNIAVSEFLGNPFGEAWTRLIQTTPVLDFLGDARAKMPDLRIATLVALAAYDPTLRQTPLFTPIPVLAAQMYGANVVLIEPAPGAGLTASTLTGPGGPQPGPTLHVYRGGNGAYEALVPAPVGGTTEEPAPVSPVATQTGDDSVLVDGREFRLERAAPGGQAFVETLLTSARGQLPNSPLSRLTPEDAQRALADWFDATGPDGAPNSTMLDDPESGAFLDIIRQLIAGLDTAALSTVLGRPADSQGYPGIGREIAAAELINELIDVPFGDAWNRLLENSPALAHVGPLHDLVGDVRSPRISHLVAAAIHQPQLSRTPFVDPAPAIAARALGVDLTVVTPEPGDGLTISAYNGTNQPQPDQSIFLYSDGENGYAALVHSGHSDHNRHGDHGNRGDHGDLQRLDGPPAGDAPNLVTAPQAQPAPQPEPAPPLPQPAPLLPETAAPLPETAAPLLIEPAPPLTDAPPAPAPETPQPPRTPDENDTELLRLVHIELRNRPALPNFTDQQILTTYHLLRDQTQHRRTPLRELVLPTLAKLLGAPRPHLGGGAPGDHTDNHPAREQIHFTLDLDEGVLDFTFADLTPHQRTQFITIADQVAAEVIDRAGTDRSPWIFHLEGGASGVPFLPGRAVSSGQQRAEAAARILTNLIAARLLDADMSPDLVTVHTSSRGAQPTGAPPTHPAHSDPAITPAAQRRQVLGWLTEAAVPLSTASPHTAPPDTLPRADAPRADSPPPAPHTPGAQAPTSQVPVVEQAGADGVIIDGRGYQVEPKAPGADSFIDALITSLGSQFPNAPIGAASNAAVRDALVEWFTGPSAVTARRALDDPRTATHRHLVQELVAGLGAEHLRLVLGHPVNETDPAALQRLVVAELVKAPYGAAWRNLLAQSPALSPLGGHGALDDFRMSDLVAGAIADPRLSLTPLFDQVPEIAARALNLTLTRVRPVAGGGLASVTIDAPGGPRPGRALHLFHEGADHYGALVHAPADPDTTRTPPRQPSPAPRTAEPSSPSAPSQTTVDGEARRRADDAVIKLPGGLALPEPGGRGPFPRRGGPPIRADRFEIHDAGLQQVSGQTVVVVNRSDGTPRHLDATAVPGFLRANGWQPGKPLVIADDSLNTYAKAFWAEVGAAAGVPVFAPPAGAKLGAGDINGLAYLVPTDAAPRPRWDMLHSPDGSPPPLVTDPLGRLWRPDGPSWYQLASFGLASPGQARLDRPLQDANLPYPASVFVLDLPVLPDGRLGVVFPDGGVRPLLPNLTAELASQIRGTPARWDNEPTGPADPARVTDPAGTTSEADAAARGVGAPKIEVVMLWSTPPKPPEETSMAAKAVDWARQHWSSRAAREQAAREQAARQAVAAFTSDVETLAEALGLPVIRIAPGADPFSYRYVPGSDANVDNLALLTAPGATDGELVLVTPGTANELPTYVQVDQNGLLTEVTRTVKNGPGAYNNGSYMFGTRANSNSALDEIMAWNGPLDWPADLPVIVVHLDDEGRLSWRIDSSAPLSVPEIVAVLQADADVQAGLRQLPGAQPPAAEPAAGPTPKAKPTHPYRLIASRAFPGAKWYILEDIARQISEAFDGLPIYVGHRASPAPDLSDIRAEVWAPVVAPRPGTTPRIDHVPDSLTGQLVPIGSGFDAYNRLDYSLWNSLGSPISDVLFETHSDEHGVYALNLAPAGPDQSDIRWVPERVPGVFQVAVRGGLGTATVQLDNDKVGTAKIPPAALAAIIRRNMPTTPGAPGAVALVTPQPLLPEDLDPATFPVMLATELDLPVHFRPVDRPHDDGRPATPTPVGQWPLVAPLPRQQTILGNGGRPIALNLTAARGVNPLAQAPTRIRTAVRNGVYVVIVDSFPDGRMALSVNNTPVPTSPLVIARLIVANTSRPQNQGIDLADIEFWVRPPEKNPSGGNAKAGYQERITRFEDEVRDLLEGAESTRQLAEPEPAYPGPGSLITLNDGTAARTVHLGSTIPNDVDELLAAIIASAAAQHPTSAFTQLFENLTVAPTLLLSGLRSGLADLYQQHLGTLAHSGEGEPTAQLDIISEADDLRNAAHTTTATPATAAPAATTAAATTAAATTQAGSGLPRLLADLLGVRLEIHTPTSVTAPTITGGLENRPSQPGASTPAFDLPTVAVFEDDAAQNGDVRFYALQPIGAENPLPRLRDDLPVSYDETFENAALENSLRLLRDRVNERFPDLIPATATAPESTPEPSPAPARMPSPPPRPTPPSIAVTPPADDPDAITVAPAGQAQPFAPFTLTTHQEDVLKRVRARLDRHPARPEISDERIISEYQNLLDSPDSPLYHRRPAVAYATLLEEILLHGRPGGLIGFGPGDPADGHLPADPTAPGQSSRDGTGQRTGPPPLPAPPAVIWAGNDQVIVDGRSHRVDRVNPGGDFLTALITSAGSQLGQLPNNPLSQTTANSLPADVADWLTSSDLGSAARARLNDPASGEYQDLLDALLAGLGELYDGVPVASPLGTVKRERSYEPSGEAWENLLQLSPVLAPLRAQGSIAGSQMSDLVAMSISAPDMWRTPFVALLPELTAQAFGIDLTLIRAAGDGGEPVTYHGLGSSGPRPKVNLFHNGVDRYEALVHTPVERVGDRHLLVDGTRYQTEPTAPGSDSLISALNTGIQQDPRLRSVGVTSEADVRARIADWLAGGDGESFRRRLDDPRHPSYQTIVVGLLENLSAASLRTVLDLPPGTRADPADLRGQLFGVLAGEPFGDAWNRLLQVSPDLGPLNDTGGPDGLAGRRMSDLVAMAIRTPGMGGTPFFFLVTTLAARALDIDLTVLEPDDDGLGTATFRGHGTTQPRRTLQLYSNGPNTFHILAPSPLPDAAPTGHAGVRARPDQRTIFTADTAELAARITPLPDVTAVFLPRAADGRLALPTPAGTASPGGTATIGLSEGTLRELLTAAGWRGGPVQFWVAPEPGGADPARLAALENQLASFSEALRTEIWAPHPGAQPQVTNGAFRAVGSGTSWLSHQPKPAPRGGDPLVTPPTWLKPAPSGRLKPSIGGPVVWPGGMAVMTLETYLAALPGLRLMAQRQDPDFFEVILPDGPRGAGALSASGRLVPITASIRETLIRGGWLPSAATGATEDLRIWTGRNLGDAESVLAELARADEIEILVPTFGSHSPFHSSDGPPAGTSQLRLTGTEGNPGTWRALGRPGDLGASRWESRDGEPYRRRDDAVADLPGGLTMIRPGGRGQFPLAEDVPTRTDRFEIRDAVLGVSSGRTTLVVGRFDGTSRHLRAADVPAFLAEHGWNGRRPLVIASGDLTTQARNFWEQVGKAAHVHVFAPPAGTGVGPRSLAGDSYLWPSVANPGPRWETLHSPVGEPPPLITDTLGRLWPPNTPVWYRMSAAGLASPTGPSSELTLSPEDLPYPDAVLALKLPVLSDGHLGLTYPDGGVHPLDLPALPDSDPAPTAGPLGRSRTAQLLAQIRQLPGTFGAVVLWSQPPPDGDQNPGDPATITFNIDVEGLAEELGVPVIRIAAGADPFASGRVPGSPPPTTGAAGQQPRKPEIQVVTPRGQQDSPAYIQLGPDGRLRTYDQFEAHDPVHAYDNGSYMFGRPAQTGGVRTELGNWDAALNGLENSLPVIAVHTDRQGRPSWSHNRYIPISAREIVSVLRSETREPGAALRPHRLITTDPEAPLTYLRSLAQEISTQLGGLPIYLGDRPRRLPALNDIQADDWIPVPAPPLTDTDAYPLAELRDLELDVLTAPTAPPAAPTGTGTDTDPNPLAELRDLELDVLAPPTAAPPSPRLGSTTYVTARPASSCPSTTPSTRRATPTTYSGT
ncbi:hypothetical protein [Parafrankia sp. CH37]|uniref:hypothetical protein n=1 Tax=Parafrankia sp. CH37 TaxID=683308 RepID=UPI00186688D8|nr:hypothetical protein [Parafrankia sp. CH37]MBE3202280.1 hypothetical protein [Parafrankia sp. CH37]